MIHVLLKPGLENFEHYFANMFSSVQFSSSVVSHELQHARPPCPSPTPRVHSNSCPSSQWCHPAISTSVVPFSPCPQSLPASESFPMSQLFTWGGPSIGVSALASFLPKNTQDWSPLEWTGWISLQSKGLLSLLQYHSSKASILRCSAFFTVQLSHPQMTTGKTIALTRWTFVGKVVSLLLNMLSRLVITFLPSSKGLLILWLQSLSAVILEPQKIKSDTVSTVSPSISDEVMGPDAMTFIFWMLSFKPTFSLSSFTFIKRLFSSSSLVRWKQLWNSLNILWHCLSFGLEWKLTFSSHAATAKFSKFAGILNAALSQHHLLAFEIAQMEFHHFH